MIVTTIVAGPPLAGKTTYVREHAQATDIVFDYDKVHAAISNLDLYRHDPNVKKYVIACRWAIYDQIEKSIGAERAWIITSSPSKEYIQSLADRFNARVIVLMVEQEEAHQRSDAAGRPNEWHTFIDNWFENQEYDQGDFQERKMDKSEDSIERRVYHVSEIRAVNPDPEATDAQPSIEGTAVVYNALSEEMWGFREIIEPGFFEGAQMNDVRAFWNHNTDLILGRTKNGSLTLNDTERGLDVHIVPPDTTWGHDALATIKRGDVDQMSFGFSVREGGDDWRKDEQGHITRVLKRGGCEQLFEVSPVAFPAYPQTSAQVRSKVSSFTQPDQVVDDGASDKEKAQARRNLRKRKLQIEKQR